MVYGLISRTSFSILQMQKCSKMYNHFNNLKQLTIYFYLLLNNVCFDINSLDVKKNHDYSCVF